MKNNTTKEWSNTFIHVTDVCVSHVTNNSKTAVKCY